MRTNLFSNFVDGEWIDGETLPNVSPADTSDVVGEFAQADSGLANQAIAAARKAAPGWRRSGIAERHRILRAASDELSARAPELGRLLAREEGKSLAEAQAEVMRAAQVFDFFAGQALRLSGEILPSVRAGVMVEVNREPVGVVGIITPWNFPIAIPAWKIAPALCYGNTVVFKPASLTPACAWALVDILNRAGLPRGVINLVVGSGRAVGQVILDHPEVDAISFTGSALTGRLVAAACARAMRKVQLEMGGKNPLVVLDDADLDVAVDCAAQGAFFSTGQRCTASSRLIVTEGIHDRFVEALSERISRLRIGNPLDPATDIGPVVSESQLATDLRYIETGQAEGANLATGGEVLTRETDGYYLAPALFTECSNGMRICQEEIFGPVAAVIRVRDYDEALHVANETEFGLSAGICTQSMKYAADFRSNSQSGMTMLNVPTAGVDYHVPFGGRKGSSLGQREQGTYAAEFYTALKTSYLKH